MCNLFLFYPVLGSFVVGITANVILWGSVAVAAASTALSVYGQYQAGQAAEATANYNAKLAENEALAKEQQSHVESLQMQKNKERLLASQRAGFAKAGAVGTEGTPLLLMAEQAGTMELDILNQQRNRAMQATALRSEADLQRYTGEQAASAATIGAGATLLSGIGSTVSAGYTAYPIAKSFEPK